MIGSIIPDYIDQMWGLETPVVARAALVETLDKAFSLHLLGLVPEAMEQEAFAVALAPRSSFPNDLALFYALGLIKALVAKGDVGAAINIAARRSTDLREIGLTVELVNQALEG